jgi:hypothetical protein
MKPEDSLLRLYEPQLDPALSQSSPLPHIVSYNSQLNIILPSAAESPTLNKHHLHAESGSETALNTTLR